MKRVDEQLNAWAAARKAALEASNDALAEATIRGTERQEPVTYPEVPKRRLRPIILIAAAAACVLVALFILHLLRTPEHTPTQPRIVHSFPVEPPDPAEQPESRPVVPLDEYRSLIGDDDDIAGGRQ